jgi:hypothetical protein
VFYYLDPPVVNVEILPGLENELGKKMFLWYFLYSCTVSENTEKNKSVILRFCLVIRVKVTGK